MVTSITRNNERERRREIVEVAVPPCRAEAREWAIPGDWEARSHAYEATVPAAIADAGVSLSPTLASVAADAALELAVFDRSAVAAAPAALPTVILAEALASSLVDGHVADAASLARAEAGQPTTASARVITAAAGALAAHLEASSRALSLGAFATAHSRPRRLASGAATARPYRREQVWEGGGDLWPRGADFVPPHPDRIADAMDDLVSFASRDDVDPMAQAAIVHAQVATIRPFGAGDTRVAAAALHGVWRRRRVSTHAIAPVAAALLAEPRRHRAALASYCSGDAGPIIALVARAVVSATASATRELPAAVELAQRWHDLARPRSGSAAAALLPLLATHPIVDSTEVRRLTGASQASAYDAIQRLAEAGVLARISPTRRETVWAALDVFQASIDLASATSR